MKISVEFDLSNPADEQLFNVLRANSGGGLPTTDPQAAPASAAPPPTTPPPTPTTPAAPAAPAPAAPAAPVATGLMPGMGGAPATAAPVAPAPAATVAGGEITRADLITKMASSVKSVGPAAVIERLRRDVAGFTDIPSSSVDIYPQINAVLDSIIAGQ